MREGICNICLSRHPIRPRDDDSFDLFDLDEDDRIDAPDEDEWVMDTHDAFGTHCHGSGTLPQAILPEEPSEEVWSNMTDDELRRAAQEICDSAQDDDEIRRRMHDELGYPGEAEVTTTVCDSMRASVVQFRSPSGNTILA